MFEIAGRLIATVLLVGCYLFFVHFMHPDPTIALYGFIVLAVSMIGLNVRRGDKNGS